MTEISSSQGPISTQQSIIERASAPRGRAAGNLTNVGNSEHQPTSVSNSQLTVSSNENQFVHLQDFIHQGLKFEPKKLAFESNEKAKDSMVKKNKSKAIKLSHNDQLKLHANKFISEFRNNGASIELAEGQKNIITNESFINGFKLAPGFAEFLLQDAITSGIIGEHLHLFVKINGGGYVASEDVPYEDPVLSNPRGNNLINSQLSEGEQLNPDDVKSYDTTDFSLPETSKEKFFDSEKSDLHPQGSTANTTNIFNNINNDNRVINNYPVYIQNIFNYFEPAPNNVNQFSPAEQVLVADYDPAQKAMVQHLPEGSLYLREQNDGANNIAKNLKAVTVIGSDQQLSENPAESFDQPDGLSATDNLVARQENDNVPEVAAFHSVLVPEVVQTDLYGDRKLSFSKEVTKRTSLFATPLTGAHVSATPDVAQSPSGSVSVASIQTDSVRDEPSLREFSKAADQPDQFAAPLSGASGTAGADASQQTSGNSTPQGVQTDGARGNNKAAADLNAGAAAADATQQTSGNTVRQAVQTDSARDGQLLRGISKVADRPAPSAASPSGISRTAVTDAAKRPSGSPSGMKVQTDGARSGNKAAANLKSDAVAADAVQSLSESILESPVQNSPWKKVIKNGKTFWINERQEQPMVSLSEKGITYRRMNIPNITGKNFK